MSDPQLRKIRNTRPATRDHLHDWIRSFTGVTIARTAVCRGHQAPFDPVADQFFNRPPITLTLGSRGSGKSFTSGISAHLDSRFNHNHGTRVLGGSKDQSRQIYEALSHTVQDGHGVLGTDADTIEALLKESATYHNGSNVAILAASSKSVRGPHVPKLRLDEVDEIDPLHRESAMGMCMNKNGYRAGVDMTSTWHKPAGPMAELIGRAQQGEFPLYTYCVFEVLERCPTDRSGSSLENCVNCPIVQWCHEDRISSGNTSVPPKAKISNGHYSIDSLIQKVKTTSKRVFEADYLCKGPKADGIWFPNFDKARHVTESAEYNPIFPVHLAIDIGNRTGAVWFQVRPVGDDHFVSVFADFYSDNAESAESTARAILAVGNARCNGKRERTTHDPAGLYKTSIGPAVIAEYERAGLKGSRGWPIRPVPDSLALLESFVGDATGTPWLSVHPRCKHLIDALQSYQRGGKAPQWSDMPKDPQHPAEDLIDALRGGLCDKFPDGRKPKYRGPTTRFSGLAY